MSVFFFKGRGEKKKKNSMKHFGFAFKIHVLNATPKPLLVKFSTPLSLALPTKR